MQESNRGPLVQSVCPIILKHIVALIKRYLSLFIYSAFNQKRHIQLIMFFFKYLLFLFNLY